MPVLFTLYNIFTNKNKHFKMDTVIKIWSSKMQAPVEAAVKFSHMVCKAAIQNQVDECFIIMAYAILFTSSPSLQLY